jgi:tRNA U38,U39,U40 pseudouridine synthase TruA
MSETKSKRKFDFSKHFVRKVALRLSYIGWNYHGFASQQDSNETIEVGRGVVQALTAEAKLFDALEKTCLIEHRDKCAYSRCARTDKGVSAIHQVTPFPTTLTPLPPHPKGRRPQRPNETPSRLKRPPPPHLLPRPLLTPPLR